MDDFKAQMLGYQKEHGHLHCDFCGEQYTIDNREDDWLNACERCAAEGAAQLELDEQRYPVTNVDGPETYTYSPNRPRKVYTLADLAADMGW